MIDTNLLVVKYCEPILPPRPRQLQHARQVLDAVSHGDVTGYVAMQTWMEFAHVYVKSFYSKELSANRNKYLPGMRAAFPSIKQDDRFHWNHLLKTRTSFLKDIVPDLRLIEQNFIYDNLWLLQPNDLGAWKPEDKTFASTLLEFMHKHELDSGDAMIVIEAKRIGCQAIVSMDRDIQKVSKDLDVYTWSTS